MPDRKLVYGFDYRKLQELTTPDETIAAPLSREELAELGIPARKLDRVREELARLALQDSRLLDRDTLCKLAKQIAGALL